MGNRYPGINLGNHGRHSVPIPKATELPARFIENITIGYITMSIIFGVGRVYIYVQNIRVGTICSIRYCSTSEVVEPVPGLMAALG